MSIRSKPRPSSHDSINSDNSEMQDIVPENMETPLLLSSDAKLITDNERRNSVTSNSSIQSKGRRESVRSAEDRMKTVFGQNPRWRRRHSSDERVSKIPIKISFENINYIV